MPYKVRCKSNGQVFPRVFTEEYRAYEYLKNLEEVDKEYYCYEDDDYEIIEVKDELRNTNT